MMDTNKIAGELVRIAMDLVGARKVRPGDLQVGDVVRHTKKFLQSTGWYTDVPRGGEVVEVVERGFMDGWPVVEWDDGVEAAINPANIELVRKARTAARDDDDDWDLNKLEIKAKKFRQDLEDNGWRESGIAFYTHSKYPDIFIDANALTSTIYAAEEWDSYSHMVQTYDELQKELRSKHYKIFVRRFNNNKKIRKSSKWKLYRGKGVHFQDEAYRSTKYPDIVTTVSWSSGNFLLLPIRDGMVPYISNKAGEARNMRELESMAAKLSDPGEASDAGERERITVTAKIFDGEYNYRDGDERLLREKKFDDVKKAERWIERELKKVLGPGDKIEKDMSDTRETSYMITTKNHPAFLGKRAWGNYRGYMWPVYVHPREDGSRFLRD
jgi:hypothetical protein